MNGGRGTEDQTAVAGQKSAKIRTYSHKIIEVDGLCSCRK
jgi:hypothetical protein